MMSKLNIFVFLILSWSFSDLMGEEINTSLSRHLVEMNESFTVTFTSQSAVNAQPDFTPLQADFDILSKNQSYQTTIHNGQINQQYQWTVELMGKKEGSLTIPSIAFGKDHSATQTVEVTTLKTNTKKEKIFLESSISPSAFIYEQTQIIYTLRLYYALNLAQGSLTNISVNDKDAIIEKIGNDFEFDHMDDQGIRYRVIERKYSVIPQHAGELIFAPIQFQGKVMTGKHSFFDMQYESVRVSSNEVKIDVKHIPLPFNQSNWFPANDVNLSEEWSTDLSKISPGDPITWTVTVTALGTTGSQIPTIQLTLPAEFKHYLDKPQVDNKQDVQGQKGIKQFKVALIPTKPGQFIIPEITAKWWDLKMDQLRISTLPSRMIEVKGSEVSMHEASNLNVKEATKDLNRHEEIEQENKSSDNQIWALLSLSVPLITVLYFIIKKRRSAPKLPRDDSISLIKRNLKMACMNHDAKQAEILLLAWANQVLPQIKALNVAQIKPYLPISSQDAIADLNRALYSLENNWNGTNLWNVIDNFRHPEKHKKNQRGVVELLRKLYP